MDLDFIGKLLGGQTSSSPISALLPLLLGGKTPDLSSLLGSFPSRPAVAEGDRSFPPLFGEKTVENSLEKEGMMQLLGNLFPTKPTQLPAQKTVEKYPYELQYNRPYKYKSNNNSK